MATASKVKPCILSHKQNLLMLRGFNFIYHLRATSKVGAYLNKSVCNKTFQKQVITYTELHNAYGIASLCHDCRKSILHL